VTQFVVAGAIAAVAVVVAALLNRRRRADAPTQPRYEHPRQLDRGDFGSDRPWLLAVFSSATCHTCADVVRKAEVLASSEVGVVQVEYGAQRELHERYDIQAVPMVVLADAEGVVHVGIVGPISATDLWADVARAREAAAG
jgi:alkyl hydroperoxide reductase subunit AhpF